MTDTLTLRRIYHGKTHLFAENLENHMFGMLTYCGTTFSRDQVEKGRGEPHPADICKVCKKVRDATMRRSDQA